MLVVLKVFNKYLRWLGYYKLYSFYGFNFRVCFERWNFMKILKWIFIRCLFVSEINFKFIIVIGLLIILIFIYIYNVYKFVIK